MTKVNEDSKICHKCKEEKTLEAFDVSKSGVKGRHNYCKQCRTTMHKKYPNAKKPDFKFCKECTTIHPSINFSNRIGNRDGLQSTCKECQRTACKNYSSTLDGFLKRLFHDTKHNAIKRAKQLEISITVDDLKTLYEKQSGKCAITGIDLEHSTYNYRRDNNQHIINKWNISLDRIDSSKGYSLDNVHLVGAIVNRMKTDLNMREFVEISSQIYNFNKDKAFE
jgi:hypothetical protein